MDKSLRTLNKSLTRSLKPVKSLGKTLEKMSWTKEPLIVYIVFFIALMNAVAYASMMEHNALLVFLVSGLLLSLVTKNMTLVLLGAILITNVLYLGQKTLVEGMETKSKKDEKHDEQDDDDDTEEVSTHIDAVKTASDNLKQIESVVGKDGLDKMQKQIEKYTNIQEGLGKQLESVKPMINTMTKMLENMPGAGSLLNKN